LARAKYFIASLFVVEYCLSWADNEIDRNKNNTGKKKNFI
jgi:hypothetical protein